MKFCPLTKISSLDPEICPNVLYRGCLLHRKSIPVPP